MKRFLIALLLLLQVKAQAQLANYNTTEYWSQFVLERSAMKPVITGDTCLVFVSNRFIHPDSLRFVDEYLDTTSLKYFFLEKLEGKWKVYQAPSLDEAMELLPHKKDIVVYAEGMGKIFTSNVYRAQLMSRQYDVNVVMFDYSSINTTYKPSKNFRIARLNARLSAGQYLQMLQQFQKARQEDRPWISGVKLTTFYHSMGNIILEQMVQQHDISSINSSPFVDNLVINAACVPQRGHAEWVERIRFAKQVYVHYNQTDLQLKGAHVLTLKKQLGEKASRRQRADNAIYINFHDMVGWQHSYFMNFPYNVKFRLTPAMTDYFSRLFNGQGISSNEALSLFTTSSNQSPAGAHQDIRRQ